jgi:hypothetical protein
MIEHSDEHWINIATKQAAVLFARWLNDNGYSEYDESDRSIAPHNNYNVYTTEQLYDIFFKEETLKVNNQCKK